MTPQEKAEELFKKYSVYNLDNGEQWYVANKFAKQCVLIAADELIEEEKKYNEGNFLFNSYWEEVKQEIEKL